MIDVAYHYCCCSSYVLTTLEAHSKRRHPHSIQPTASIEHSGDSSQPSTQQEMPERRLVQASTDRSVHIMCCKLLPAQPATDDGVIFSPFHCKRHETRRQVHVRPSNPIQRTGGPDGPSRRSILAMIKLRRSGHNYGDAASMATTPVPKDAQDIARDGPNHCLGGTFRPWRVLHG